MNKKCNFSMNNLNEYQNRIKTGPVIGLFINNLYHYYGAEIYEGIKKGILENKASLFTYVGGSFNNPYINNNGKNSVFKLAEKSFIDGIIIISSSIASYINKNDLLKFLKENYNIPVLSIGISFNNISSITINNETAMEKQLDHLINYHGYKKVAFVKGPENNIDAIKRYEVYKKCLIENNIPFNESIVYDGSFHVNCGKEIVDKLMINKAHSFDAIVASNDYVGLRIIEELNKYGIRVPDDIAVVGYDNIEESKYGLCSLTTVNQPTFELGYKSIKMMMSMLNGEKCIKHQKLNTQLIIRKSCGCCKSDYKNKNMIKSIYAAKLNMDLKSNNKNKQLLNFIMEILKNELDDLISYSLLVEWSSKLYFSLIQSINELSDKYFFNVLKECIDLSFLKKIDINLWNCIMLLLFNKIIYENSINCKPYIIKLLNNTLSYIHSIQVNKINRRLKGDRLNKIEMITFKKKLSNILNYKEFEDVISNELPMLGLRSCYVCIYHSEDGKKYYSKARLLTAYNNENNIKIKKDNTFDSFKLLPDEIRGLIESENIFIYSLCKFDDIIGYVIYDINFKNKLSDIIIHEYGNLFESLSVEISNTIKNIQNYNKVETPFNKIVNKIQEDDNEKNQKYNYKLPEKKAKMYYKKLLHIMNYEKPYIYPDLTLVELANKLNIPRNHLSYIINYYSGQNFYDFINSYRIEEAKIKLSIKTDEKLVILDVAYNSGFNSKSTFNRFFKEYTKLTPKEYRKKFCARV